MSSKRTPLYEMLPKWVRFRDHYEGLPLQILMDGLEGPLREIERSIDELYDSWFIETCADWQVPYLGDLLGVQGLEHPSQMLPTQRRRVANTLTYRRSKGTLAVIARAAEAATGWPCHGVESRRLVAVTSSLGNVQDSFENQDEDGAEPLRRCRRGQPGGAVDLRDHAEIDRLGSPFTSSARWADVRRPAGLTPTSAQAPGGVDLQTVNLAFWRLSSYPVEGVEARLLRLDRPELLGRKLFSFHPFGIETPLFNRPLTSHSPLYNSGERHLPMPLLPRDLASEIKARRDAGAFDAPAPATDYFEHQPPFRIELLKEGGQRFIEVPPEAIEVMDLSRLKKSLPAGISTHALKDFLPLSYRRFDYSTELAVREVEVVVDPVLGWLVTGQDVLKVRTDHCYGGAMDLGGGPYDRHATHGPTPPDAREMTVSAQAAPRYSRTVLALWSHESVTAEILVLLYLLTSEPPAGHFGDLRGILEELGLVASTGPPRAAREEIDDETEVVIRFSDSGTYLLAGDVLDLGRRRLVLQADEGVFPMIYGSFRVLGDSGSHLHLNGLRVEGRITLAGQPSLTVEHCTLNPLGGWREQQALRWTPRGEGEVDEPEEDDGRKRSQSLTIRIRHSVVGPMQLPQGPVELLDIQDSIIDGGRVAGEQQPAIRGVAADASYEGKSYGPATRIERATIFGSIHLYQLWLASNVLFNDEVIVERHREGRLRYCYCPSGQKPLPGRHKCLDESGQVDDVAEPSSLQRMRVKPTFTSTSYGHPGYAQLSVCAEILRRGGENGNEIGVYHALRQSDRLTNLNPIMDAYLPVGFKARIQFMT